KSTVTTLVAKMCEVGGLRVLAGANLGTPALDLLSRDIPDVYVLELSSFQLHRTHSLEPKVAALLNVTADHLDWHASEAEYVDAKRRIFARAQALVVNRDDPVVMARVPANLPVVSFGLGAPGKNEYGVMLRPDGTYLARGDRALIATKELALVGQHNQANALAALAIAELLGLDVDAVVGILREFQGLPHRMQRVAQIDGVDYINDSKATNVAASIASVRSLPVGVILLAGGQGKGGDFSLLARETANHLAGVIVFGEDAGALETAFNGKAPVSRVVDLPAALARAAEIATAGQTVLLAPACASFDQFPNYAKRGDAFSSLVRGLAA
ncbi:MAG: UDP-N-acetylmuramoyl-L-alanine--D-glutamate ligase, partial [Pseudomonadota bacterium]